MQDIFTGFLVLLAIASFAGLLFLIAVVVHTYGMSFPIYIALFLGLCYLVGRLTRSSKWPN